MAIHAFQTYEDVTRRTSPETRLSMKWYRRYYNIPSEAKSIIPACGDIMPGYGRESWETETHDLLKPRVQKISRGASKDAGRTLITVTCVEPEPFGTEYSDDLQELNGRNLTRRGMNWYGTRVFLCAEDVAITRANTIWGTSFPGVTGSYIPICREPRITYHPFGLNGLVLINAVYKTPGITILPAGQATLKTIFTIKPTDMFYGPDNKLIKGVDETGVNEMRVISGENRLYDVKLAYVITGHYKKSEIPYASIKAAAGKLNSNAFSKPSAAIGTLRLIDVVVLEEYLEGYSPVKYVLEQSDGKWETTSRPGAWKVETLEVMSGTTPQNKTREVLVWHPNKKWNSTRTALVDADDYVTSNFATADMSFIPEGSAIVD